MRPIALVAALAGCNAVFNIHEVKPADGGAVSDGGDADGAPNDAFDFIDAPPLFCTDWGVPTTFSPGEVIHGDPTTAGDDPELLNLYYVRNATPPYEIGHASRISSTMSFQLLDATFETSADDRDPAFTADAARVVFLSDRGTGLHVYEATIGNSYQDAAQVLQSTAVHSIDLSPNGLTLYYALSAPAPAAGLYASKRADLSSMFSLGTRIGPFSAYPTVMASAQEMYYSDTGMIYRRTRLPTDQSFGNATLMFQGTDPDLSSDGQRMHFVLGGEFAIVTRSCE